MTDACIVLTTIDNLEQAKELGRQLVELRLAACVNIVDRIHSIYRWQGEVETADEILLVIKTAMQTIPALKEKIIQLHPYEVPEVIVLPVVDGTNSYLKWLLTETQSNS